MERLVPDNINTVEYWNGRFSSESDFVWDTADIVDKIRQEIPMAATVLDAGVGGGILFRRLQPKRPDLRLYGCDFSSEAIYKLSQKSDVRFERLFIWDVRNPHDPSKYGVYDVVVSTELLEHMDQPEGVIKNLAAAARQKLIVTVPNRNAILSPEHVWSYTPEDIAVLLAPYGNVRTETVRWEFNIMGVVCKLS